MPIPNTRFTADLADSKPMRLNLGSGGTLRTGLFGVDHLALPGVDIQTDRNSQLDKLLAPLISALVNVNFGTQNWYERRLCWLFHAWKLEFVLCPVKAATAAPGAGTRS